MWKISDHVCARCSSISRTINRIERARYKPCFLILHYCMEPQHHQGARKVCDFQGDLSVIGKKHATLQNSSSYVL